MIRLFAAIGVPDDVGETLLARQSGIDNARWRPLEALHITLRFFGDIPENKAEDVDAELARIVLRPFAVTLSGAGAFGEGRDVNAVWAGVEDCAPLRELAAKCETAARRAGLKAETRNYLPHVTLAYLTRPNPEEVGAWIQANNLLRAEPFYVSWFSLYSSRMGVGGSRYEVERDYALI